MLYIFTSAFPYGAGEGFLEEEIDFLSKAFDYIDVIPFANFEDRTKRELPPNFSISECIIKTRTRYNVKGLFNAQVLPAFLVDFFKYGVYKDKVKLKSWLVEYNHTCSLLNSKVCKDIKKNLKDDDVIYSYWGRDAYSLCVFWRDKCKFVARFHGSTDLWEDYSHNYKPLRNKILRTLDLAAPVSEKGTKFLSTKYICKNVRTCYLGARDSGIGFKSTDSVYRVLSCSNLVPLKRVPMILKAIQSIDDIKIEWTHIGSGDGMNELLQLTKNNINDNLKIKILGQLSHNDVLQYYKENPVDVFINLSTIEGIPVSVMEAISFNVPVVATDVGATSEVVNDKTGILLSANPSLSEIKDALLRVRKGNYEPKQYWREKFDAQKNFSEFSSLISNL